MILSREAHHLGCDIYRSNPKRTEEREAANIRVHTRENPTTWDIDKKIRPQLVWDIHHIESKARLGKGSSEHAHLIFCGDLDQSARCVGFVIHHNFHVVLSNISTWEEVRLTIVK